MQRGHVNIYRENYRTLPERFIRKIEHGLQYIIDAGIPDLNKVFLFGSCARGKVHSTSDVDLLILTREKMQDRMLAADIRWTLDEPLEGIRTDVVYMNEDSIKDKSTFKDAVNKSKRLILEVEDSCDTEHIFCNCRE